MSAPAIRRRASVRADAWLARKGQGALWCIPIEERQRCLQREHTASVRAGGIRRLGADDDLGLWYTSPFRRLQRQPGGVEVLLQGEQVAAHHVGPLQQRLQGRHIGPHSGLVSGDQLPGIDHACEVSRQPRLRLRTFGGGGRQVRVKFQALSLGTQSIESGRVSGGLSLGQDCGEVPDAGCRGSHLQFSRLCGDELREGDMQVGSRPAQGLVDPQAGGTHDRIGCIDREATAAGDGQHLAHHEHVFAHARD